MTEINYAEREQYLSTRPSLDDCRKLAQTHRAYGWSPRPYGDWSQDRVDAYMDSFYGRNTKEGE